MLYLYHRHWMLPTCGHALEPHSRVSRGGLLNDCDGQQKPHSAPRTFCPLCPGTLSSCTISITTPFKHYGILVRWSSALGQEKLGYRRQPESYLWEQRVVSFRNSACCCRPTGNFLEPVFARSRHWKLCLIRGGKRGR